MQECYAVRNIFFSRGKHKGRKKIFYINDNTVNKLISCEFMVADEIPELKNMGIDSDMIYAVVL